MLKKIIIGFLAGLVNGLFATGGGLILVPAFVYLLKLTEQESRATSLFCILPLVLVSGIEYYTNNYINWEISIKCAIGGIIGGLLGAKLLKKVPDIILNLTFTVFLIYVSIKMMVG